nr:retrovirus-related Pol polyprotein from transposon TNT 1-94 [Tanacetum cinerariifolium]
MLGMMIDLQEEEILIAKKDEAKVILFNEQNDFLLADASEMEELEELSVNIYMMARIQKVDNDSEDGPSFHSSFIIELQNPSTSFMNLLFSQGHKERENAKLEYQKLFDSIKKTLTQTQKEINEPIESINQKKYAYGDVRSHDQDLLIPISKLKVKLKHAKEEQPFTTHRTMKTKFVDTTLIVAKTRPMRVEGINGKKYILVIVDDYSRYTWVYFLQTKYEAPNMVMNFIAQRLSLSFDFFFESEIFKSLSFSLDRIFHLAILSLDQHAHTLHHLESSLIISPEA